MPKIVFEREGRGPIDRELNQRQLALIQLQKVLMSDLRGLAGPTGLEPATSGVTGQRSNQLNYDPARVDVRRLPNQWAVQGSNL